MPKIKSGSRKYASMLREQAPKTLAENELLRKRRKNTIEEWKLAAKNDPETAAVVKSLENAMEIERLLYQVNGILLLTLQDLRSHSEAHKEKLWEKEVEEDNKTIKSLYEERSEIIRRIPNFWPAIFMSDYELHRHLNEVDKMIIKYLSSVVVEHCLNVKSGYTITFIFNTNPYFKNSSLTTEWSFSHIGLVQESGTKIKWYKKKTKDTSTAPKDEVLEKNGSKQSQSFFTWFFDPLAKGLPEKLQVAQVIRNGLWRAAPVYFKNVRDNVDADMNELMKIHAKIQKAENEAFDKRCKLDEKYDLEDQEIAVCESKVYTRRLYYQKRSAIVETIPHFWSTAFLGHYALGAVLSEEDQKIFRYLKSVNVEESEGGASGYTITFNFAENRYFKNKSLTKKILYTDEGVDICGCPIYWEDGLGSTSGNQQESPDKREKRGFPHGDTSFFTWFFVRDEGLSGVSDEVANLIINDLWPNAVNYFVNGNFTDEEEEAIDADCRFLLWSIEK